MGNQKQDQEQTVPAQELDRELEEDELAQVAGGMSPHAMSMLRAGLRRRTSIEGGGKPIDGQVFPSSGTASKG